MLIAKHMPKGPKVRRVINVTDNTIPALPLPVSPRLHDAASDAGLFRKGTGFRGRTYILNDRYRPCSSRPASTRQGPHAPQLENASM